MLQPSPPCSCSPSLLLVQPPSWDCSPATFVTPSAPSPRQLQPTPHMVSSCSAALLTGPLLWAMLASPSRCLLGDRTALHPQTRTASTDSPYRWQPVAVCCRDGLGSAGLGGSMVGGTCPGTRDCWDMG